MKLSVVNWSNQVVKDVDVQDDLINSEIRKDILARVVAWQLAKRRQGNHLVKNRAEVKHTKKKPFKQKGTGRARQGMTSAPNLRGGGVAFGPVLRDHSHSLNKKIRRLGLKVAVSSKMLSNKLLIMDTFSINRGKTSELKDLLNQSGISSALFVYSDNVDSKFQQALSNLVKIDCIDQIGLNVYDILRHDYLVFTQDSVKMLEERLYDK